MVIVVCGPGGVGKGTVVREVVSRDPKLRLSRSWTTRDRRPGEDVDAYTFATRAEFEARIAADGFLEWAEFLGNFYGSPTVDGDLDGRDLLLEIDVQGAAQVRCRHPETLVVFLDAPSRDEQERRLRGRGDTDEQVVRRLAKSDEEAAAAAALGAVTLINDDLDRCVTDLAELIDARRAESPA